MEIPRALPVGLHLDDLDEGHIGRAVVCLPSLCTRAANGVADSFLEGPPAGRCVSVLNLGSESLPQFPEARTDSMVRPYIGEGVRAHGTHPDPVHGDITDPIPRIWGNREGLVGSVIDRDSSRR